MGTLSFAPAISVENLGRKRIGKEKIDWRHRWPMIF
jgi:hypothetical protein